MSAAGGQEIGKRLRLFRVMRGLTQAEVAEIATSLMSSEAAF